MKLRLSVLLLLAVSIPTMAERYISSGQGNNHGGGGNTDVVVNMPPEAWSQGRDKQPPCARCCIFENRNYTEGAVLKSEGVLLQCARDEQSLGTNNLIWRIVK